MEGFDSVFRVWEDIRVGVGTLIGQFGQLALGIDDPLPFLNGFGACLYDKGILGRFLEIPTLEISRNDPRNGLARLRATFEALFFKSKKCENFFLKKISILKNREFF